MAMGDEDEAEGEEPRSLNRNFNNLPAIRGYGVPAFRSYPPAALYSCNGELGSRVLGTGIGSSSISPHLPSHIGLPPMMRPRQWSSYMNREIELAGERSPPLQRKKQIFPVPEALFEVRPQAYCPRLLTIGPLCRRLVPSPMDRCKALCVKEFLQRCLPSSTSYDAPTPPSANSTSPPSTNDMPTSPKIADLVAFLARSGSSPIGKAVYFGLPNFDKNALQLLIAVDSVFIFEFICFLAMEDKEGDDDYNDCNNEGEEEEQPTAYLWHYIHNHLNVSHILRDLFIVGNQVPLSYVISVAEYGGMQRDELVLVLAYMIWRCSPFISSHDGNSQNSAHFLKLLGNGGFSLLDCEHLLDCLYQACVKSPHMNSNNTLTTKCSRIPSSERGWHDAESLVVPKKIVGIPRVSDLKKVGVNIKGVSGNTSAIRYDKKKLIVYLPKIVIYDGTECTLRNLVAYELTSKEGSEICDYVMLMDSLIDTSDDLEILYKAGVLENHLGSDKKLLAMWNDMCVNISKANSKRWDEMAQGLMTRYKTNWRVMYFEFHRLFLSRPWLLLSTITAVLLLFMTALQTIYSTLSFYKTSG